MPSVPTLQAGQSNGGLQAAACLDQNVTAALCAPPDGCSQQYGCAGGPGCCHLGWLLWAFASHAVSSVIMARCACRAVGASENTSGHCCAEGSAWLLHPQLDRVCARCASCLLQHSTAKPVLHSHVPFTLRLSHATCFCLQALQRPRQLESTTQHGSLGSCGARLSGFGGPLWAAWGRTRGVLRQPGNSVCNGASIRSELSLMLFDSRLLCVIFYVCTPAAALPGAWGGHAWFSLFRGLPGSLPLSVPLPS